MKNFWVSIKKECIYLARLVNHLFRKISRKLSRGSWRNVALIFIIGIIFFGGVFLLWAATLKTPDLQSFDSRLVGSSTKIYDRTGTIVLYDVNQRVRRTVVPFNQISQNIKNATISIEDEDFYKHSGISITSIARAILVDISHFSLSQGGSTITQQVVKNALLTNKKTFSRKIEEWILAIKLEREADKETILNLYLNEIPYGGNIYGIEEASEAFFGVHANELTLVEAAYIAALTQAPSYYSPYGLHKEDLMSRKNLVLKNMRKNGYINEEEYQGALATDATFLPQPLNALKAPHFVMYVKGLLEQKYGADAVAEGGLKVITTLDYDMQQKAEKIASDYIKTNQTKFNAENGAMVATDPKSGQILMMVGSRDYFDTSIQGQFNAATGHRQPGSSFKPFVYVTAFEKGYTPDTILFDVKTEFSTQCSPQSTPLTAGASCYSPVNYEGGYKGPMSIRAALAQSRNVPAVEMLYLAGIQDSLDTAHALGINSLKDDPSHYGLPLVLGGGEVSPLDMASAYGVFANDGVKNPATPILEVDDKDGNILEQFATSSTRVLPEQANRALTDILADNSARAPIFGSKYLPGYDVGIKTGTTNNSRDAWIIGYTPNISVSAWMGNNDNKPMKQIASALIVAPMWKQFMLEILPTRPNENFIPPEPTDPTLKPILRGVWQGGSSYTIDTSTGLVATDATPPELRQTITQYNPHSILYWVDKNDPTGPAPTHPEDDPEYTNWEYGVQNWLIANGQAAGSSSLPTLPTSGQSGEIKVTINNPSTGSYNRTDRVAVTIQTQSLNPITRVDYYLNGSFLGQSNTSPFTFSFVPSSLDGLSTQNKLQAVAYDSLQNKGTGEATLFLNQ